MPWLLFCCQSVSAFSIFRQSSTADDTGHISGFMNRNNNMPGMNSQPVMSPIAAVFAVDDEQIPSETATTTEMTTVSPTHTTPILHQPTSAITAAIIIPTTAPFTTMVLTRPPPRSTTSDYLSNQYHGLQHQYRNDRYNTMHNARASGVGRTDNNGYGFDTLPLHTFDASFHNHNSRWDGNLPQQIWSEKLTYLDSAHRVTPPKLPRRTTSSTNPSSNNYMTSSYM